MSQHVSSSVRSLHAQFRFYGKNAREWMRKCVLMLSDLERERVWEKKGFRSLAEYAGRLSGMSKEMVYEGLRVLRAVEGMPEMMKVIEQRGIGIVRPVLTLLTHDNQKFWAEKMRGMSKQTLTLYRQEWQRAQIHTLSPDGFADGSASSADMLRPGSEKTIDSPQQEAIGKIDFHHSQQDKRILITEVAHNFINTVATVAQDSISTTADAAPSPEKIFAISLKPEIIEQLEKLNGKDGDWSNLMEELLRLRSEKLERELLLLRAQKLEREQQVESGQPPSRHIPAPIQRFVIERSRGVCEVGACRKKYAILHHIQRFALEKAHDPSRIIALCTSHERLVHLGLIEDEHIAPRKWKILEQPDQTNQKYRIDQLVQKYRRPG